MPSFRYIPYVLIAAALLGARPTTGQEPRFRQLGTLDDGQQRRGRLLRSGAGKFVFESGSASIPVRRLVRVEFPATADVQGSAAPFRVSLWGGEHLAVQVVRLTKQSAQLILPDQTELTVDRTALSAVSTEPSEKLIPAGRLSTLQDQLRLVEGDELFGALTALDDAGCTFRGTFPPLRFEWDQVRQVRLRRANVRGRSVRGLLVRLHLRNSQRPADDDVLLGAVQEMDAEGWLLDHPHLGRFRLPRSRVRAVEILGEGMRVDVESAEHHLGNDIRAKLLLPLPDGTELVRTFTLETVPAGSAKVVCEVLQLESAQRGGQFAGDLKQGHLRTNLWINDRPVDFMNRHVVLPIDQPQWLRIALPTEALRSGANTLRISQTPLPDDKSDFDDFLMANLALQFSESSE